MTIVSVCMQFTEHIHALKMMNTVDCRDSSLFHWQHWRGLNVLCVVCSVEQSCLMVLLAGLCRIIHIQKNATICKYQWFPRISQKWLLLTLLGRSNDTEALCCCLSGVARFCFMSKCFGKVLLSWFEVLGNRNSTGTLTSCWGNKQGSEMSSLGGIKKSKAHGKKCHGLRDVAAAFNSALAR